MTWHDSRWTAATARSRGSLGSTHPRPCGLIETLFVEHRFNDAVKWNLSFRNVDHHDEADAFDIVRYDRRDPTFQTLTLRARGQRNRRTYVFGDTYFTFHFTALGEHRMIAGASLGHAIDDFNRTKFCAINSPDAPAADPTCNPTSAQYTVRANNPDFSVVPPLSAFGPERIALSLDTDEVFHPGDEAYEDRYGYDPFRIRVCQGAFVLQGHVSAIGVFVGEGNSLRPGPGRRRAPTSRSRTDRTGPDRPVIRCSVHGPEHSDAPGRRDLSSASVPAPERSSCRPSCRPWEWARPRPDPPERASRRWGWA